MSQNFSINAERLFQFFPDIKYSDPVDLISQLADAGFDLRNFTDHIEKTFVFSSVPHKIKTIAFYHTKLRNGGIERVNSLLSGLLAACDNGKKYKVIMITDEEPSSDDYELHPSVSRYVLPAYNTKEKNYRTRAKSLSDLISQQQIDAFIYSNFAGSALLWDMLTVKTHELHPAFFIHFHNFIPSIFSTVKDNIGYVLKAYAMADGIVTLSDFDRRFIGMINRKAYMVWNPCIPNRANKKNLWKGSRYILWIGRLSPEKQPLEIVKIMKHVVKTFPDAVCHVVGSDEGNYQQLFRNLISREALENNIVLEGFHGKVEPFFEKADIFLSTAEFEGFPSTFMETAAYGIPAVTYDLPWLEYYKIIKGWTSVDQYDAERAADAVVSLFSDRDLWEKKSSLTYESYQIYKTHDIAADWNCIFDDYENGVLPPKIEMSPESFQFALEQIMKFHVQALGHIDEVYGSASYKLGNMLIRPLNALRNFKNTIGG